MGYRENLIRRITDLSTASDWLTVCDEWDNTRQFKHRQDCICGKDIHNVYVIENKVNGKEAEIGSCCVRNFMPKLYKPTVLDGFKRIGKDFDANMNQAAIDYSISHGFIDEKHREFLEKVKRKQKRTFTDAQAAYKRSLNSQAYYAFTNQRPPTKEKPIPKAKRIPKPPPILRKKTA